MLLVCNQVTESTDSGAEVQSPDLSVGQDVLTETTESTEFTDYLKPSAAIEPTNEPEEELDQSTGLSLNDLYCKKSVRHYHLILDKTVVIRIHNTMRKWCNTWLF